MRLPTPSLLLALACAATPAFAHEAGDIIVRGGLAQVSPDVSSDTALAPLQLDVDDNLQLGLTVSYLISPRLGVEVLAATPFKHDITSAGSKVGSTKHLPPTVSLQWYPLHTPTVQPYVGAGLNYTLFFSEKNTLGVDLELTDSVGLALEAGVDVKLNDQLMLNVAVWKIDINTDVKINGAKAGELELDPFAAMLGVGMRF